MFRYSILYYIRSITRRKLFSSINIIGLSFGIAFMILIGQFLYYEFNYNHEIKNVENIYRVVDTEGNNYNIDYRMKEQILQSVPGVKNACVLNHFGIDVNVGNKFFQLKHMLVVDQDFFNVFKCSFISGNPKEVFNSIDNIVLTEKTAKNIFGTINVVGKTLRLNHQYDMMIAGVVKDLPENISFGAELFVNVMNTPKQRIIYRMSCFTYDGKDDSQCQYPFNVFVELNKNADIEKIEKQISSFNKINSFRFPKKAALTPFKTNYFNTVIEDYDLLHGNKSLIKILSLIGMTILLLAVINFINLTTASYRYRLKEIGVKKYLGAGRPALIKQLILESLLTCIISSLLGILIAFLFLPYFNQFVDKSITLQIFSDPIFFALFVSFILLLGILTGFLPAIVLSRISPLQLFKSNPHLRGTGKGFRGVLTAFQFSMAIILISGLIVISKQIDFVKHKDPGFNTDRLIYLKIHYTLADRVEVLSNKLQQYHGIKSLTKTCGIPGDIRIRNDNHESIIIDSASMKTFGFKVIKGRNLLPGDMNKACLINMAAYKHFKNGDFQNHKVNGADVVGVVSDFHYSSLYTSTGPLALFYSNSWYTDNITMRISGSIGETMNYINKTWKEICPDYPIDLNFYDEHFASMYAKEENLASFVSIFSILAVIISCLGIFGLSVYQSEQRVKEIGIRKVLGAGVPEITLLLSKSFAKWVILANVIAVPVSYYFLNLWLQDFAYRITISWWVYVLSGVIALVIAFATVSFQAIKAATANPVESLRYE